MFRSDPIRRLQEWNPHLHPSSLEAAVKEIIDHVAETLTDGGHIEVRGFGSFALRHHAPRAARNPKTGEPVEFGSHCRVHFKPGLELRERVNTQP